MKLRVKLGRETRMVNLPDRSPSSVTLAELTQEVSVQFAGLENCEFSLSLNKENSLSGLDQPLSEFGLVSGDLLHIIGPDLPEREPPRAPHPKRQPLASHSSGSESSFFLGASASNYSASPRCGESELQKTSMSDGNLNGRKEPPSTHEADRMSDMELESPAVNRFMLEPLELRESSSHAVPILLEQLYRSASCGSASDALWVAVHALMLEAGFSPCECVDEMEMPTDWKRPGFYTCSYTYSVSPLESSACSVSGVTLGSSLAVHAIPQTESEFKTDTLQLTSSHYVRELSDHIPSVYRALDRLSRQVKDVICLPLINEMVTAAGFRERQGFFVLPREAMFRVLTYLDARSLCRFAQTCQEMKTICSDRTIWRHLFIRDFGRLSDVSLGRQWNQLYKDHYQQRRDEEEQMRHRQLLYIDPNWPAGPFRPMFPPNPNMPFPPELLGGDYDLLPGAGMGRIPPPMGGGRGGNPFHLPGPSRLDPLSGAPVQPGRRGNLTGSPFFGPSQSFPFF